MTQMTRYFLSISLLAGSIIAYEIVLVRLFSISQWHHFAQMIISLALLGFGASGSVIALAQRWLIRRFHLAYTVSGLIYAVSAVGCFALNQSVPFNPFMLVWQPGQIFPLFARYLILSIPFFFGAACIGLALVRFNTHINRLYFFDLVGSGIGALGIIGAMYVIPSIHSLTLISAVGFCSILIANFRRSWRGLGVIFGIAVGFITLLLLRPIEIKISPYKGLSSTLNFPDSEILTERHSPLGLLQVVRSQSIRAVPGLSLGSTHEIPPQLGLFTDADAMTPIAHFDGDLSKLAYLDDTTSALAYHLLEKPRVLVLGAGGGGDVLKAIYHRAESVDAVELNPQTIELVERVHGDFAGHIYAPDSRYPVRVHIAEARGFLQSTTKTYNLIQISLLDSVGASAAGTHALSESYLYTVEAISGFFGHLTEGGVVSITRWLKSPPRDMLKLFATTVEALEQKGQIPAEQLALIRGWRTGTLLIKKGQFQPNEIEAIRRFCNERSFDLAYYPQMPESEANRYNLLPEPIYFRAAQEMLFGNRQEFYETYPFDIRPTTDNRPYFFQFLRLGSLLKMIQTVGRSAIPFVEWGYLLLIATLIQAILAGLILILTPLLFLRRRRRAIHPVGETENRHTTSDWRVLVYFSSLGVGFMFIEMAFIQKFILLLSYPTYAIAVVLCAFLVFAGFGSFCSQWLRRLAQNSMIVAIGGLSLIALLYLALLPRIFDLFLPRSDALKVIASICLIAPLAFFMGMPFPLGIALLRERNPDLIAWAWGINGCASVVSAALATCLAIAFGFNAVVLLAVGVYGVGLWSARW
jgi:hypothetical protein